MNELREGIEQRRRERADTILLALTRREAYQLYEHLMEQPYTDATDWQFAPIGKLADALGIELPAWIRTRAEA